MEATEWIEGGENLLKFFREKDFRGMAVGIVIPALSDREVTVAVQGISPSAPYALFILPVSEDGSLLRKNIIALSEIKRARLLNREFVLRVKPLIGER